MPFRTKLDYSDNRQIKQHVETRTELSGATSFGVPFSALTTGPSTTISAITNTINGVISTFSGNTGTTVYSFTGANMNLGTSYLTPITPVNSGTTKFTGNVFTGDTSTTIDDNLIFLTYTGVNYSIFVTQMEEVSPGNYTGTTNSNIVNYLSASTLDFTSRTIWVDVPNGITRTQDLIITRNPVIGNVWTCIDSEGKGNWNPSSGNTNVWSASTGNSSAVLSGSSSIASGNFSVAEGLGTIASGGVSHAEGISTIASGDASHAEGEGTIASGPQSHAEGNSTLASGFRSHAEGSGTLASGELSHAEGRNTTASGINSHAEGYYTTASGYTSHAGGFDTLASGENSFIHSSGSIVTGNRSVVLGGSGLTGATDDYVYVPSLNIKSVGSSAFLNEIRIDATGNLTTNTSDIRFKENINNIIGGLDKINRLQGVTYQWKDRTAGGDDLRLGFIAQSVEEVDSLLVFTNKIDGYKGIHIDGIIPLLVEAVKELSSGVTTSNNTHLETQTILAEDNNIDLNYSGTQQTSVGGGITVLHAMGQDLGAQIITDSDGNWITNNDFKPSGLTIPIFTPTSTNDTAGNEGNITRDDNFLYVKGITGWKRSNLESF